MKGFIEVNSCYGTSLLNVKHIEEVRKGDDGKCTIYLAFNVPNAVEQDYVYPDETYDEIVRKIKEATEWVR